MKKLFLIITAFAFIGSQGQVQNSSLQKGLIADIALSEWHVQPGAAQTSGTVTSGSTYILALFVAGDDFTNIGAVNVSGSVFKATGTTPTTWTNSSIVRPYNSTVTELISRTAGTITDVTVVTGKNGQGSDRYNSYNGTSSYTLLSNTATSYPITVTGSFYITSLATNNAIFSILDVASAIKFLSLSVNTDGSLIFYRRNTTEYSTDTGYDCVINTWYNYSVIFTNATTVTVYINGTSVYTSSALTSVAIDATFDDVVLGILRVSSPTFYLDGRINKFKIFNRALTAGEVQAYSNATTEAGDLITGLRYRILTLGNTTWASVGATGTIGEEFTATGVDATATEGTCKPLSTSLTFADKGAVNTEKMPDPAMSETLAASTAGTNWTTDANWTMGSGVATYDGLANTKFLAANNIISALTPGQQLALKFDVPTGTARIRLLNPANGEIGFPAYANYTGVGNVVIFTNTSGSSGFRIFAENTSGGTAFTLDNVSLVRLGNTLNLDASGIRPTTWYDATHAITGTNTSVTTVIPPSSELQAMDFNGSTSKILALPDADFDGTGAKTIAGWMYLRSYGEATYGYIITDNALLVRVDGGGTKLMTTRDDATYLSSSALVRLNDWIFYTVTSTSAGITSIYFNGVLDVTGSTGTPADGDDLYIGNNVSDIRTFDGMISPIRIYDRVLTVTEVLDLYNKTK